MSAPGWLADVKLRDVTGPSRAGASSRRSLLTAFPGGGYMICGAHIGRPMPGSALRGHQFLNHAVETAAGDGHRVEQRHVDLVLARDRSLAVAELLHGAAHADRQEHGYGAVEPRREGRVSVKLCVQRAAWHVQHVARLDHDHGGGRRALVDKRNLTQ